MSNALVSIEFAQHEDQWVAHIHYRGSRIAPGAPRYLMRPTRTQAYEGAKSVLRRYGYTRHCVAADVLTGDNK